MRKCPQCGQHRKTDEYRCLSCGCFYSHLDEILAAEEAEQERQSVKGRLQHIMAANNSKQALFDELLNIKENTPTRTFLTLAFIFIFIFALIVSVL